MNAIKNSGVWLTLFMCCIWPLIFHAGILYFTRTLKSRDWTNVQWSDFRFPWRKQ